MNKSRRNLTSDIAGVFGSNVFTVLLSFIIDVILSRELEPEGRGLYTSLLVVPLIAISFTLLGIRRSAVFHIGKKMFHIDRIVSGVIQLYLITSFIAMLICLIGFVWFTPEKATINMMVLAILSIPVKLALIYSGGIFLGKEQFALSNRNIWLPVLLNVIGILIFVTAIKWSVYGALLALLISNLLVAILSLRQLNHDHIISFKPDKEVIFSLVKLGIGYAIAVMIMQLNYRVDLLFLQKLSDMKQVGYYSLGVAISEQLWQLPTAIGIVVLSRTANSTNDDELNVNTSRLLRLSFLAILIISLILYFIIPYVLPFFYGSKFIPSSKVVQTMLPGILFFVIPRILNSRFAGIGQPQQLLWIFIPTLILNMLLNYCWIPNYGAIGAAWASNISYILGSVALLILFSKKMNIPLKNIVMIQSSDFNFLNKYFQFKGKS